MTQQPEALRLADRLDLYATGDAHQQDIEQAAAELIVLECVDIIEKLPPGYKDYRDQIEDAFRIASVVQIKQRFGVK